MEPLMIAPAFAAGFAVQLVRLPPLIGFALSFSGTVFAVKVLEDRSEIGPSTDASRSAFW
jgi:predicted Kef-type K+ transport protein